MIHSALSQVNPVTLLLFLMLTLFWLTTIYDESKWDQGLTFFVGFIWVLEATLISDILMLILKFSALLCLVFDMQTEKVFVFVHFSAI